MRDDRKGQVSDRQPALSITRTTHELGDAAEGR
jgi:hypothetical protein